MISCANMDSRDREARIYFVRMDLIENVLVTNEVALDRGDNMNDTLLISKWALIRRKELADIPENLEIHPDFLQSLSHEVFESAFWEVGDLFYQIYTDMADNPQRFGLPLYQSESFGNLFHFEEGMKHVNSTLTFLWQL